MVDAVTVAPAAMKAVLLLTHTLAQRSLRVMRSHSSGVIVGGTVGNWFDVAAGGVGVWVISIENEVASLCTSICSGAHVIIGIIIAI